MASLVLEKPASIDPVSLADMKNYLRVEIDDDDALITGLIAGCTLACETFTRRSFINKGFRMGLDSFPYFVDTTMSRQSFPPSMYALPRYSTTQWNYSQMIKVFRPPLVSVDRVTYLSNADNQYHDMVPVPPLWYPGTQYTVNQQVMDNNGCIETCVVAGTSDSQPPPWNGTAQGNVTVEAVPDPGGEGAVGVQWRNDGPLPAAKRPPSGTVGAGGLAGATQFGSYLVDNASEPGRIFPGPPGFFWPQVLYVPSAVQVHFTAGYGDTADKVPPNICTAIMQLVSDCYEYREPVPSAREAIPAHVKMLLWPSVVLDFAPTAG